MPPALFCLALLSLAQPPNPLATIEGQVINPLTQQPIRKAKVSLRPSQPEPKTLVATTDAEGHFRFADIPPGRYHLTAEKTGFLSGTFGAHKPDADGTLLKVASGDTLTSLTLELFPGGTISGRIVDEDNDPIPGSELSLWKRARKQGKFTEEGQTESGRSGEYTFEGLPPGIYYVSAKPPDSDSPELHTPVDQSGKVSRLRPRATYFPAATSPEPPSRCVWKMPGNSPAPTFTSSARLG